MSTLPQDFRDAGFCNQHNLFCGIKGVIWVFVLFCIGLTVEEMGEQVRLMGTRGSLTGFLVSLGCRVPRRTMGTKVVRMGARG